MLGNRPKKYLREQNWLGLMKEYENPYDAWRKIRISVNNTIDEFPLLVNLPKEKQEALFTHDNIKKILKCLTFIDVSHSKKIEIAAQLAIHGLMLCKREYQNLNKDIPDISRLTSEHLDLAIRICNDISYKSITNFLETSALEKNEIYLLNWHKVLDRDKTRLERFIITLIKKRCEIFDLRYLRNKTIIEGSIKDPEQNGSRTFKLQIYPYEDKVVFRVNDVTAYIDKLISHTDTKVTHLNEKKLKVITPGPPVDDRIGQIKPHYEKKVKVVIDNDEFLLYERKR